MPDVISTVLTLDLKKHIPQDFLLIQAIDAIWADLADRSGDLIVRDGLHPKGRETIYDPIDPTTFLSRLFDV